MSKSKLQFFALLQSGLWDKPIDSALFAEAVNWQYILEIAKMQTVTGIVYDGINSLPSELQPPAALMRKLHQTVIRIEQSHELLNKHISMIVPKLEAAGIHSVLLKGQGVAQNYPNPLRRQCGDIDLYVGRKNCNRAMQLLLSLGATTDTATHGKSPKHEGFYLGKVSVELHFLVEKLRTPLYNKRFQRWVDEQFCEEKLLICDINGTDVHIPTTHFNALYIFNHAYHHFIVGGTGFRQLCDWVMFLHTFHHEINWKELFIRLKSFGLLRAWQIFGCIAVDYLGLVKEEFPFYKEKHQKYAQRAAQDILSVGNFGFYNPDCGERPDSYLGGKLYSFANRIRRFYKLFPLFPKQTADHCLAFVYIGIKLVINDLLKK